MVRKIGRLEKASGRKVSMEKRRNEESRWRGLHVNENCLTWRWNDLLLILIWKKWASSNSDLCFAWFDERVGWLVWVVMILNWRSAIQPILCITIQSLARLKAANRSDCDAKSVSQQRSRCRNDLWPKEALLCIPARESQLAHTTGKKLRRGWNAVQAALEELQETSGGRPLICVYNSAWTGLYLQRAITIYGVQHAVWAVLEDVLAAFRRTSLSSDQQSAQSCWHLQHARTLQKA